MNWVSSSFKTPLFFLSPIPSSHGLNIPSRGPHFVTEGRTCRLGIARMSFSALSTLLTLNMVLLPKCPGYWLLYFIVFNFYLLVAPNGMGDLSSQTRDWTHIPCIARWILNHWTTREVPVLVTLDLHPQVPYRRYCYSIKRSRSCFYESFMSHTITLKPDDGSHKRPHSVWFHLYEISRIDKSKEAVDRLVVTQVLEAAGKSHEWLMV